MKRQTVTFLILFCFQATLQLKAQHRYLDNNPIWVVHSSCNPGNCLMDYSNIYYYLKGYSIFGGYRYHRVFKEEIGQQICSTGITYYGSNDTINPVAYLRDTLQQIREYNMFGDTLLYEFNLSIGDTLRNTDFGYTTVDSIDSIPVSNYFRKRFALSNQNCTHYLYEGIGNGAGFLEHLTCTNVSSDCYYTLYCYGFNDTAWYPTLNAVSPCTIPNYNIGISELRKQSNEIIISPNPFTTQTTINFGEEQKNTTIKITDLLGKEIKTFNFTGRQFVIEKAQMKAGIYFVQTTDGQRNVMNGKIIIQ